MTPPCAMCCKQYQIIFKHASQRQCRRTAMSGVDRIHDAHRRAWAMWYMYDIIAAYIVRTNSHQMSPVGMQGSTSTIYCYWYPPAHHVQPDWKYTQSQVLYWSLYYCCCCYCCCWSHRMCSNWLFQLLLVMAALYHSVPDTSCVCMSTCDTMSTNQDSHHTSRYLAVIWSAQFDRCANCTWSDSLRQSQKLSVYQVLYECIHTFICVPNHCTQRCAPLIFDVTWKIELPHVAKVISPVEDLHTVLR